MQDTWVGSLGREDPLQEEMAIHSSLLAWEIPWTEETGGLEFLGSQNSQAQLRNETTTTNVWWWGQKVVTHCVFSGNDCCSLDNRNHIVVRFCIESFEDSSLLSGWDSKYLALFLGFFPWSVQFSSVAQSCPTLCDPMNHSTPGLPIHYHLPEFTQTHVHRVGDAIQPSHPLLSPSPPAPNSSQHQSLFQWVNSSHEVAKVLEFQL